MDKKDSIVKVGHPGLGAPGWLMFAWEHGGEEGLYGISLADGDMDGFDSPYDDAAYDALTSWIEAFRERLLERCSWPSREEVCDFWEEAKEDALRVGGRPSDGVAVVPQGPADPGRSEVYVAGGGYGSMFAASAERLSDERFVGLLERHFEEGKDAFGDDCCGGYVADVGTGSVDLSDEESVVGFFQLAALCRNCSCMRAKDERSGRTIYAVNDRGFVRWGFAYAERDKAEADGEDCFFAGIARMSDFHYTEYGDLAFSWRLEGSSQDFGGECALDEFTGVVRGLEIVRSCGFEEGAGAWMREFAEAFDRASHCRGEAMRRLSDETRRIDALRDKALEGLF